MTAPVNVRVIFTGDAARLWLDDTFGPPMPRILSALPQVADGVHVAMADLHYGETELLVYPRALEKHGAHDPAGAAIAAVAVVNEVTGGLLERVDALRVEVGP